MVQRVKFASGIQTEGVIVASCRLSLHACNRFLFERGLSIDSRSNVISQHMHWPIRTPRPTCAKQDVWVVITPKRPKSNSIHTAAWHAWTRTPPLRFVIKAVYSLIHFPASFIYLSDLGGSRHGWGLFLEQTAVLHMSEKILKRLTNRYKWQNKTMRTETAEKNQQKTRTYHVLIHIFWL